ncbi:MAG: choice-of-anchor J domain-containing protein [Prevotella sp.]|nr:choice-of-anchor J domain-containing protein [Prevotella sp.]
MGKRKLLYLLLMAFLLPLTASAQQAIPYSYGFEDNNLDTDGWTTVDCHANSKIISNAKQNGSYGFRFYYTTTPPQYLISPELTGTDRGVEVSFSYKQGGSSYHESFQVGYSTTTADVTAFTWETELTTTDTSWHVYEASFPAGTKYVAVKCTSDDQLYLYLDDFSFEAPASCPKPTSLAANNVEARSAIISWTSDADGFNLRFKAANDNEYTVVEGVTNPYTLEDLTPETQYAVSVQAVCSAEEQSTWTADVTFTTPEACPKPTSWAQPITTAPTQLQLGWVAGSDEQDTWEVAYTDDANYTTNNTPDESWQYVTVNQTNVTVTDLEQNTKYWFAVRAVCSAKEKSAWHGPAWLQTEKLYPEPTEVEADNITAKSADISWTKGRDEKKWNLRYRPVKEVEIGDDAIEWTFNGSLGDWTSVDNDGDGYEWDAETFGDYGVIGSASYVNNVGALSPDNWLISPQIDLGGTLVVSAFGIDANYPSEVFAIYVSTTDTNPSSFTKVAGDFTATASATNYTADLSAYSGKGYVAIRHYNCSDWYWLVIDKISYSATAIEEEPWIEENGITENPYTITGLTPETDYEAQVQGVFGDTSDAVSEWSASAEFTTLDIKPADVAVTPAATTAELTWNGSSCSYDVRIGTVDPDAAMIETELKYDDGEYQGGIGTGGGQFYWASVFNGVASISKVSVYDGNYPMTGTVTIYNGGTNAPEGNPVAEMDIELTGAGAFVDVTSRDAIELDPSKPTWVVVYNESGGTYPAAYSTAADANGRWVSMDGSSWSDVQSAVASVGSWMIRVTALAADPDAIIWNETASTSETSYTFEGLDPETSYVAEVRANCEEDDEISDWVRTSFTTLNAETPVSDIVAENITKSSADIDWTANGAEEEWNLRYRKTFGTKWGFEDGMGDWFTVDADGDGYGWNLASEIGLTAHNGQDMVYSQSYDNNVGPLTPDNWLVSPEVTLGGTLTFWAKGQDASWAAENFGVFVTTTSMDEDSFNASAFTQVDADVTATGEWTLYTFDLSGSGTGRFAIRHYECTDMYFLDVDDITYISPDDVEEEWTVVNGITEHPYTIEDLEEDTEYEVQVQSVFGKETSDWSESCIFTTPLELIVLDNDYNQAEGETNTDLLEAAKGKTVDFTISGRTLYKDGSWNTIALPFVLLEEDIENSPLAGATIKTVDPETSVIEGTHVTLNMIDYKDWCEYYDFNYNLLYPSYPYFVKWNDGEDIVDPTFRGVSIYQSEPGIWALNEEESIIGYGLFSSIMLQPASQLEEDESPIYYMGADNKLKFTGKQRLLNAFRAGFSFETPEDAGALEFTINFGDETTTGIAEIDGADSKVNTAHEGIYNLQGVKLNSMPKQKGVYINNGKKVIIK